MRRWSSMRPRPTPLLLALGCCLVACGGGGSGSSGSVPPGLVGTLLEKPGGDAYFLDEHRAGTRSRIELLEMSWGRLVDVYALDADGELEAAPTFRDLLIREDVLSDGLRYRVETNQATLGTRLVVLRERDAPDDGSGTFEDLVRAAKAGLAPVTPKHDVDVTAGPLSLVPRNATLMLRFDDLLDDSADAQRDLGRMVYVVTGAPPAAPFQARLLFDPNHGGLRGGSFHSTRVLIDLTVSPIEASLSPDPLFVNVIGLPASLPGAPEANAAIRIPTATDPTTGQFQLLRSVGGAPVEPGVGPFDPDAVTQDVVRAFRSGNEEDQNRGALLDIAPPEIVGSWRLEVTDPRALGGVAWELDLAFVTGCSAPPREGDVVEIGAVVLEVLESGGALGDGRYDAVPVRVVAGEVASPFDLVGAGALQRAYDPNLAIPPACWITVLPETEVPGEGLSSGSLVQLRFTEPMAPETLLPLDTLYLVRGALDGPITAQTLVISNLIASEDLRTFQVVPALPLDNQVSGGAYRFELVGGLDGLRDLAGNLLASSLPPIALELDPEEPPVFSGGIALRFQSLDEILPLDAPDMRGNFTLDVTRGVIRGRPVTYGSATCDRTLGPPSIMTVFPPGVQTPLSSLGSRLHSLWRYADFGWSIWDESKYDLDVLGLYWSPANTTVSSDFYPRFSMRLTHSKYLPDEECQPNRVPIYEASGLPAGDLPFEDHVLVDPRGGYADVHPEEFGYRIDPNDLTVSVTNRNIFPFPVNRDTDGTSRMFTWRDTSVLALGGQAGPGVPMAIEVGDPLFLETGVGSFAGTAKVPSVGLPLMWEVNTFPNAQSVGLNSLAILYPCIGWPTPHFRAYSTGGTNTNGRQVEVDPANEEFPNGGFNPTSSPPGQRTRAADNSFYTGQLDYVIRVSRAHTSWMDTQASAPSFAVPVVTPEPAFQPAGTRVVLEFRGATGFLNAGDRPFDAQNLDAYGEFEGGRPLFFAQREAWTDDLTELDGARYLQMRVTFEANITTFEQPEVDSIGIAFSID